MSFANSARTWRQMPQGDPGTRPRGDDGARDGIAVAGGDHRGDRRALRAQRGPERRVLDVAPGVNAAGAREQRGADAITRVGSVRPGARLRLPR